MGKHGVLGHNIEWIHFDSAGVQEDLEKQFKCSDWLTMEENLLEPGDKAGLALLDQAILQHLDLRQLDLVKCILIG